MSSFNGVTIKVLGTNGIPRSVTADVSVRHMPGGSLSYIDIGGKQLSRLTLQLFFSTQTLGLTFEAQVGASASLVIPDGTYNAVLLSAKRTTRGLSTNGDVVYDCEFVLG